MRRSTSMNLNLRHCGVANVPGYSTEAVAEHTFALMLAVIRRIPAADAAVRHGQFATREGDSSFGFDLAGKTLGIVGLGRIGTRVAEIARGFGMKVLAWDRGTKIVDGVTQVALEQLLAQSDIVSLHLPLASDTENFLSAARLRLMKPTAVLINTARGKLVDEHALYEALRSGVIAGAGLDVLSEMDTSNPLLTLPNVVFSPHSAYNTRESSRTRGDFIVATVRAFVAGSPINVVN